MLKRLLGILALSSLLLSGAYADDILAIVSKGQLTSKSAGVKELSLEEKMQVKGGYKLAGNGSVFVFQNTNLGTARITQIGVVVELDNYERDNKVSCGLNLTGCVPDIYVNQQRYNELVSVANPNSNEFLAVTSTKTTTIGAFGVPQSQFTKGAMVIGVNSSGVIYKIRNVSTSNRIVSEVSRAVNNDLNRLLVTRF